VDAGDRHTLLSVLCADTATDFECDWAVTLHLDPPDAVVEVGDAPTAAWVAAFVQGSAHLDLGGGGDGGPDDVAWAHLPGEDLALAVGRKGRPFRWRERRQLATLAHIAGVLELRAPSGSRPRP
jgi:hypothetical protein